MIPRTAIAALFLAAVAWAQPRTPVLVELFTSEGCSSCPPADAALSRLVREQPVPGVEVIALGEHVDYWNDNEWRDRFSSPLFSARQQDYGRAFRLKDIYTPQMIINGEATAIGSDWNAVLHAIRDAGRDRLLPATIRPEGFDGVAVQVEGTVASGSADVLLAITEDRLATAVYGGENSGARLRHTGVVRSLTRLATLDARKSGYTAQARLVLNPQWNRQNLRLVLLVQDHGTRRILGVADAHL